MTVILDTADVCDVDAEWGNYLSGCVGGKFPGLGAMSRLKNYLKVECDIIPHTDGWVIFKFHDPSKVEKYLLVVLTTYSGGLCSSRKCLMDLISRKMICILFRLG